jgi:hypothetical protein
VDLKRHEFSQIPSDEVTGDLRDSAVGQSAAKRYERIQQLAADMGGARYTEGRAANEGYSFIICGIAEWWYRGVNT